jgi:hypothetical protein
MGEICFKIGEKYLYLDEELVEFDIPIFFICKDVDNQKYVVLCIDSEELLYVIGKVSIEDILSMLTSEITLRDFFMKVNEKWKVFAGEDYLSDQVEKIEKFQDDELPTVGAYFELSNDKIETYKKRLVQESPMRQHNVIWKEQFLQYPIQQQKAIYRNLDKPIEPMMYININEELCYTNWCHKKDGWINLEIRDLSMLYDSESLKSMYMQKPKVPVFTKNFSFSSHIQALSAP